MCLDKGYDSALMWEKLEEFGVTADVLSRREEAKLLKNNKRKRARRWVVERTHGWLNRWRAILVRWVKRPELHLAQLHFALGIICWRATGLLE